MKRVFAVLCLLAYCSSLPGQESPKDKSKSAETAGVTSETSNSPTEKLPIRRVVLYKNGVGYFEHLGRVRGSQDVHVDFTSAQLNEEEMENRQKDIDRIVEDQGRLRENMKALRGSAEEKALLQRYTKQLDEQETQLEALRKKIQDTEAQRDKASDLLGNMIDELQIEATL